MMREIKFRAWDEGHKKMWSAHEMGVDELTINPDGRGFVNVHSSSPKLSEYYPHMIPLQSTGLKDKNGKEIYEGDIIRYTIPEDEPVKDKRIIFWREDICGFQAKTLDSKYMGFIQNDYIEIIGNIYESPELLK